MSSSIPEKGINDLATLHPELAKEADGWDPRTIIPGTSKKLPWKYKEGHTWTTSCGQRTGTSPSGCPECAEYGFNPGKPAWFYLMERTGQQQFGITNDKKRRLDAHAAKGWRQVIHNGKPQITGPHDGNMVFQIEKKLKKWLKIEVGVVKGTTENWYTSKMEVHSLAELKEKSGIETSIFQCFNNLKL